MHFGTSRPIKISRTSFPQYWPMPTFWRHMTAATPKPRGGSMSNESLQRSVLPNNPVDPSIVRVLRRLDPIARNADCAYFVAGATARDLHPGQHSWSAACPGYPRHRFWDRDRKLGAIRVVEERLVATGVFTSDRCALQRLTYSDQAAGASMPVDLIPFRGVTPPAVRSNGRQPRYCHERGGLRGGVGFIRPIQIRRTWSCAWRNSRADAAQTCCMVRQETRNR